MQPHPKSFPQFSSTSRQLTAGKVWPQVLKFISLPAYSPPHTTPLPPIQMTQDPPPGVNVHSLYSWSSLLQCPPPEWPPHHAASSYSEAPHQDGPHFHPAELRQCQNFRIYPSWASWTWSHWWISQCACRWCPGDPCQCCAWCRTPRLSPKGCRSRR